MIEKKKAVLCSSCAKPAFFNPPTVGVAVVKVVKDGKIGFLLIERGDGGLAFVGGYQEREDIYTAIAREFFEELGTELSTEISAWQAITVRTTPGNKQNLFFAAYGEILDFYALEANFKPNKEAVRLVFATEPTELKFSIHEEVLRQLLES